MNAATMEITLEHLNLEPMHDLPTATQEDRGARSRGAFGELLAREIAGRHHWFKK